MVQTGGSGSELLARASEAGHRLARAGALIVQRKSRKTKRGRRRGLLAKHVGSGLRAQDQFQVHLGLAFGSGPVAVEGVAGFPDYPSGGAVHPRHSGAQMPGGRVSPLFLLVHRQVRFAIDVLLSQHFPSVRFCAAIERPRARLFLESYLLPQEYQTMA